MFMFVVALVILPQLTPFALQVDSRRREVILRYGPFDLPPLEHHAEHHVHGLEPPVLRFVWPVTGWLRGFRLSVLQQDGQPFPRHALHHMNLIHLGRRQLAAPIFERTVAADLGTGDAMLPPSVGVPIDSGAPMALLTAWSNQTGRVIPGVVLELRLPFLAGNLSPRPLAVLPVAFDAGFRAGFPDVFDIDTGRTVLRREFTVAASGRLLGVGGHLHDYGELLELSDAVTGRTLLRLKSVLDAHGRIVGMPRKLFGVAGAGLKLQAGRRYVVTAVYDNPSGRRIVLGGMALFGGIFAPELPERWPAIERTDPVFMADAAGLDRLGWVTVTGKWK